MRPFANTTRLFIVPSIILLGFVCVTTPQVFGLDDLDCTHRSSESFTLSWSPSPGTLDQVAVQEKRFLTGSSMVQYATAATLAGTASSWSPSGTLDPGSLHPLDGIGYVGLGYRIVEFASGVVSASAEIGSVSTYATPLLRPDQLIAGGWRDDDYSLISEQAVNGGAAPDGDFIRAYHKDDEEEVVYSLDNPSNPSFPYGTRAYKAVVHYYGWNSNSPSDPLTIQGYAPSVFSGGVTNGMSAGSVNGQWYSLAINDASASRVQMEDARIRFLTPVLVTGDEYLIDNAYLQVFIEDD